MNIIDAIKKLKENLNSLKNVINNIIGYVHSLKDGDAISVEDITNKDKRIKLNYDENVFTIKIDNSPPSPPQP